MFTFRKATVLQILAVLGVIFTLVLSPVTTAFAQSGAYPLAGQTAEATNFSGVKLPAYNPVWTPDGRNWQPTLPPGPQRVAFAVSIEIVSGTYVGNAVACDFYLDEARNGKGSQNKQVLNHENGKEFAVNAKSGGNAWLLIQCDGGTSSGYDIWATNPTYSGVSVSSTDQPGMTNPTTQQPVPGSTLVPAPDNPQPALPSGAPVTVYVDPGFVSLLYLLGYAFLFCGVPFLVFVLLIYALVRALRKPRQQ